MKVWCDGSRLGSGHGGWAWVSEDRRQGSGSAPDTTNQRMEIMAAHQAVVSNANHGPITVVTDSAYVVNCFKDNWYSGWLKRGWLNSAGKPVANRDLWEDFIIAALLFDVRFEWVKGHNGDPGNEQADQLAQAAARELANN